MAQETDGVSFEKLQKSRYDPWPCKAKGISWLLSFFFFFFPKEVRVISLFFQHYHAFDDSVPSDYTKENTKYILSEV